ncbi:MAG: type II secretion system protein GspI [Gammaproteobacteria bacterium]|nr:MAG: type II secretion system protein GspI [Gammaproteobacteria bacterium]
MFAKHRLSAPAKGFTLVEVMISLAIVSMALPALIILVMTQIDGASHIRNKTYGMWVAENELTRLTLLNNKDLFPTFKLMEKDSGQTEMMGLLWRWQFETTVAEEIPVKGIVKMDVDVSILGLSEGGGYNGAKELEKVDPIARITGYMSE